VNRGFYEVFSAAVEPLRKIDLRLTAQRRGLSCRAYVGFHLVRAPFECLTVEESLKSWV
jgi:hypothetical protein